MLVATTRSQQILIVCHHKGLLLAPCGSDGKASAYNVGEPGSIPGSKRSPGEGNGNPLQYSCLENPMDGGACGLQLMGSQRVLND